MRRSTVAAAAGALAAFAFVGFLVAASGIVSIKASSGHWAITEWLLHFGMWRSVATHSIGIEAPALDHPSLVLKGAGHYEIGCRPCHGSPERRSPRIPRAMTPEPPYLPPIISGWEPAELFYIVKHGVKFTGMPAWPTQRRDDEVWAMVAFLLRLPDLDVEEYRQLVNEEDDASAQAASLSETDPVPRAVIDNCAACHAVDGQGRGVGAFPKLAGQRPAYLFAALRAYAGGKRHSGIMEPIAAEFSVAKLRALARYYGSLEEPSTVPVGQEVPAVERGREIASRGIPHQRVPACRHCHGPDATRRNANFPKLAGQYADYLLLQLELFQQERRGGSPYARLMRPIAPRLTRAQMRDVALYYESLGAAARPGSDTATGRRSSS